jgi:FkbH-like protein
VGVVHLGPDPARFVERFESFHWFDLRSYTGDDFIRGAAYSALAQARSEMSASEDISIYLANLDMNGQVTIDVPADLARITQLEQKTNQFNLTTRRYSEHAVAEFMRRDDSLVLSLRLADKFGDHGLVSTLIGVQEQDSIRIDSWLMSCRVFSRTAEQFVMEKLIAIARGRSASTILGEYLSTPKNGVVSDLYQRLGFHPVDDDRHLWKLIIDVDEANSAYTHFIRERPSVLLNQG